METNNIRYKIILVLSLVVAIGLSACGTEEKTANPSVEEVEEIHENVSLDLMITAYNGEESIALWNDLESQFESQYDYIDLNIQVLNWDEINNIIRDETQSLPDILLSDKVVEYAEAGLLYEADNYTTPEMRANLLPAFYKHGEIDGKVFGLPAIANCRGLVCNMDILNEAGVLKPPTSWDELRDACEKIKTQFPDVIPLGLDMSESSGMVNLSCYFWSNNGGFFDSNGDISVSSQENAEALDFIKGLYTAGYCNSNIKNNVDRELSDDFENQRLAMMIGGVGLIEKWGNKTVAAGDIPVHGSNNPANYGVCDKFVTFKDNEKNNNENRLDAIKTFYEWFYDTENYIVFVKSEGFLPVTKDGIEAFKESGQLGLRGEYLDLLEKAALNPTFRKDWDDLRYGIIYCARDVLEGKDSREALDLLTKQLRE